MAVRNDHAASIRQLLELARRHLGMDVAWVSRFSAGGQVFEQVAEATPGTGPPVGSEEPLAGSYCVRVLDGRLPPVVRDARVDPTTRDLQVTETLGIGSYVGVPLTSPQGEVSGMLCCIGGAANSQVTEQDLQFLSGLADVISSLDALRTVDDRRQAELERARLRIDRAAAGHGLRTVLQPIVEIASGWLYGVEALSRFDQPPARPDLWFADAVLLGRGVDLEVAAARSALARFRELPVGAVLSVNLSPETLVSGALPELLDGVDASRVAVEVTEHAAVSDYDALSAALAPHRAAGMRVSIDDAGAGYASFRHIVRLRPDTIKIDTSLIRDIDLDTVRQSLVTSLVAFATSTQTRLVAEGVETRAELTMLAALGVSHAQGYLLGRPSTSAPTEARWVAARPASADLRTH